MKKCLITGITGQVGSHLADLLVDRGYEVHGLIRRTSNPMDRNIKHLEQEIIVHYGDLSDGGSMHHVIQEVLPDEIYNLGAMSDVRRSFDMPVMTMDINCSGFLRIIESVRQMNHDCKIYHAGTSEIFGRVQETPQNEKTPFYPLSPYAVSKAASIYMARAYRESYGMKIYTGILFNTEGVRRGEEFVTKKICKAVAEIVNGKRTKIVLGNLDAKRDWGFAPEYCIGLDVPILTTGGWKYFDEVQVGDTVINFDIKNDRTTTDIVKRKILLPSTGERVLLKGRGVYLNVSHEHRIIYQRKSSNSKGGWSSYKETTAIDFYNLLNDKSWCTKFNYRLPHFQDYYKEDNEIYSDDWLYLIGCILAEGCYSGYALGRYSELSLSQSLIVNERVYKKIEETMNRIGLKYRKQNKKCGTTEWVFSPQSAKAVLEYFDVLNVHVMPKGFYNISARQAEIVFEGMMDCDGSWGSLVYASKRYLLAVDFQTIAHLAGYMTSGITQQKGSGCYYINILSKRKKYTHVTEFKLIKDVSESVWCVNTNNGTIITRDGESISISGNCNWIHKIVQSGIPGEYVIATGETHSVREFLDEAFGFAGISDWTPYVKCDKSLFRPGEVDVLCGDASKSKQVLGFSPTVKFKELVKIMMEHELEKYKVWK